MKIGQFLQQGDVLIKKVKSLPKGLKEVKTKILQHGETTGHRHRFLDDATVQVFVDESFKDTERITEAERKFIIVGDTIQLLHEEHKPVTVEPGVYEIDIVREFNYETREMNRVVD